MRASNRKATHASPLGGFGAEAPTEVVSVYFRSKSPVPQFYPIAPAAQRKASGWGLHIAVSAASVLLFAAGMGLLVGIAFELSHDAPARVASEPEPESVATVATPSEEPLPLADPPGALAPGEPRMTWPVVSRVITSKFGMRTHPLDEETKFHRGVDILCPVGSPVVAADDGEVVRISRSRRGGILMKISHGTSMVTFYEHLTGVMVAQGEKVQSGQLIALSGSTGAVTGPHLHFEVIRNNRARNPLAFEWRPTQAPVTVDTAVALRPNEAKRGSRY